MKNTNLKICLLLPLCAGGLPATLFCADTAMPAAGAGPGAWAKPVWLTDLAAGVRESYDDNVLLVSGDGLKPQTSWVSVLSPKVGVNFAPLLGDGATLQTLSLSYAPDLAFYHEAPAENYTANRVNNSVKLKAGAFSFGLDNAFLYNDGNRLAETYAAGQGAAVQQYDKYRSNYAHAVPRERRNQIQDRDTLVAEYEWNQFFVRPTASLLDYDLNTYLYNTSSAHKGYQDYVSRYDVNGGADLGYKAAANTAVTLGYRYGHQYQQQFTTAINSDTHYSTGDYQRVLLGLEGQPLNWLTVKLAGGPQFHDYNADAAVNHKNMTTYYGEAVVTAQINAKQSLVVNYKQWQWVSSTGCVPYFDSTYGLTWHWSATPKLGLDLGGKLLTADYRCGNDRTGSAPSVRDDADYSVQAGVSYALSTHLSASLAYNYDLGKNNLSSAELAAHGVPAAVAASAGYRDFEHQVVSLGLQYKF